MNLRKTVRVLVLVAMLAATGVMFVDKAQAHGTSIDPVSRVYGCYLEGPEHPVTAACQFAVSTGGTQPLYDWNEINQANAAGNSRSIIPDGRLCSANRDKYAAFDAARTDWASTNVSAGTKTITFRATAPHKGAFQIFITNSGFNPTLPLKWGDLTQIGAVTDPPLVDGSYHFDVNLPARSGRHVIYMVWQRSDSPEAFYSCSDVVYSGGNPVPTNTKPPATVTPVPTKTNTPGGTLPDLTITNITNAPSTVKCGTGWNPGTNVTVMNNGSTANTFVVSANTLTLTVNGLGAGMSTTLRFSINGGTITAKADSTSVITESNETNNSMTKILPVSDPIPCTATPTGGTTPTKTSTPKPTPTSSSTAPAWAANTWYNVAALVTYGGHTYKCIQAHTSQTGWEPPNVPALWGLVS